MTFSKALYFAALIPPKHVKEEILQLKLEIKEKFNAAHALKLPAHITILPPFWLEENRESDLLKMLENQAQAQSVFFVELKDFGHFGQRVIYVKVVDHELVKEVYAHFSPLLENFLSHFSASSIHPHITLATRDLNRGDFQEAWKEFKNRSYSNSFPANSLFILKHNGKSWDVLKEFNFSENSLIPE